MSSFLLWDDLSVEDINKSIYFLVFLIAAFYNAAVMFCVNAIMNFMVFLTLFFFRKFQDYTTEERWIHVEGLAAKVQEINFITQLALLHLKIAFCFRQPTLIERSRNIVIDLFWRNLTIVISFGELKTSISIFHSPKRRSEKVNSRIAISWWKN